MDEPTTVTRTRYRTRYRNRGCGCGCASFFVVLTVGILLSLFSTAVSIGVSVRIPFSSSNVTVAGSVGHKDKALAVLPDYTEGRVGGNQNFFNNSTTLTIWQAEGAVVVIVGRQDGAPPLDLHLSLR